MYSDPTLPLPVIFSYGFLRPHESPPIFLSLTWM